MLILGGGGGGVILLLLVTKTSVRANFIGHLHVDVCILHVHDVYL